MVLLAPSRPLAPQLAALGDELDALFTEARKKPLNARVTAVTADTARLEWDPIDGTTVYHTGRTGTDNRGNGVTKLDDKADSTARLFVWLKAGTEYTVFVQAIPSGIGQAVSFKTLPG